MKIDRSLLKYICCLSNIPLNNDGEYVALAYHYNVDFPWEDMELEYWTMDQLHESLNQLTIVQDLLEDDEEIVICRDFARIVNKAIVYDMVVRIRRD